MYSPLLTQIISPAPLKDSVLREAEGIAGPVYGGFLKCGDLIWEVLHMAFLNQVGTRMWVATNSALWHQTSLTGTLHWAPA